MVNSVFKKKKKKRLILDPQEGGREGGRDLLLSATMSMLPSLMRSLMNLFVRSSSISWHLIRSLKSGLSRKESLNSKVGSPIAPQRLNKKSCPFIHSPQLCMYASVRPHKFQFRCDTVVSKFHLQPPPSPPKKKEKKKFSCSSQFLTSALIFSATYRKTSGGVTPAGYCWILYSSSMWTRSCRSSSRVQENYLAYQKLHSTRINAEW